MQMLLCLSFLVVPPTARERRLNGHLAQIAAIQSRKQSERREDLTAALVFSGRGKRNWHRTRFGKTKGSGREERKTSR